MNKNKTAGRGIAACLFAYLLIQIYCLSAYIIPTAPGESWEKMASLFLVQSVFFAACILAVFVFDFLQRTKQNETSPFASLLLVSGEGKIKSEFVLHGKRSFIITGKKNGTEVFLEHAQNPEPGKFLYGFGNLTGGHWYLETVSSKTPAGLRRGDENVIYKLKEEIPYQLRRSDVIYIHTYKIVIRPYKEKLLP